MSGQISTRTACRWLKISDSGLKRMRERGVLAPVLTPVLRVRGATYFYDTDEVNLLSVESGRACRRRREYAQAPESRDDDLTMTEVATMLNVHYGSVSWLIKHGILGAKREKREGRRALVWIARSEVERLKADPERRAARAIYDGRRSRPIVPVEPMTEEEYERYRVFAILNVKEAGRYLGVTPVTISKLRAYGRIDSRKIKGRVWVKRESLDALLSDPAYLARRQRYRAANTEELQALRNSAYIAKVVKTSEVRRALMDAMDW